ncbi:MAG: 4Fe-4S dicluster domain-containing protein [Calditrichia bacterium]|nr:4Fe-4S dicluster domain-containing protein [Calditrichia bacterium]
MQTINLKFREKLNRMLGGKSHNFCYQCGACVADCPAHRFLPEFNPRIIILKTLYGMEEELIGEDSIIWNCTNCYNCHERCPQEVHPIDVIIALKNMATEKGTNLYSSKNLIDRVKNTGSTVVITEFSIRKREELGLQPFKMDCIEEVQTLLKDEG